MLQLLQKLDRKAAAMINDIDSGLGEPTVQVITLRVFTDNASHSEMTTAPETTPTPARQPVRETEGNTRLAHNCAETAPA